MRSIGPVGLRLITDEEEFVSKVTPDPRGNPSVGWGHLVQPGETFPTEGITRAEALELKRRDLVRFETAVNDVRWPLAQHEYDACVSLAYNIGAGGFATSDLRRQLDLGHMDRAADLFLAYCTAKDARTKIQDVDLLLAGRRWRERAVFLGRPMYEGGWRSAQSWRDYQTALQRLGFYDGAIDGVPGPRTLLGVRRMRLRVLAGRAAEAGA